MDRLHHCCPTVASHLCRHWCVDPFHWWSNSIARRHLWRDETVFSTGCFFTDLRKSLVWMGHHCLFGNRHSGLQARCVDCFYAVISFLNSAVSASFRRESFIGGAGPFYSMLCDDVDLDA